MENTTKEAAAKYAETIAQDEVKKMYSRVDFEAGANWFKEQKLLQFEQMKTALVDVANMPDPLSYNLAFENAKQRCRTALSSLTETNEKP